jgi:hypothetical protein
MICLLYQVKHTHPQHHDVFLEVISQEEDKLSQRFLHVLGGGSAEV